MSLDSVVDVDRLIRDRVIALRPWILCSVCNVRVSPGSEHVHQEGKDKESRKGFPLGKTLGEILRESSGPLELGTPGGLSSLWPDRTKTAG